MIDSWLDVMALAAFLPFVLFVAVQAPAVLRGRSNAAGVAVFVLVVVAVLALSQSMWRQFLGTPPHWYRLVVFALVIVAGWWLLVSMLVIRRRDGGPSTDTRPDLLETNGDRSG